MKTTIMSLLVFASVISFGQKKDKDRSIDKLTPTEKATKRTEKMSNLLTLSAEQKEKAFQINLVHIENMEKIKVEKDAIREKVKNSHESAKSEFEKILSKEQMEILDKEKEERRKKHQEKKDCCKQKPAKE